MLMTTRSTGRHTGRLAAALLLAAALVATPARAQEALGYFKNYFVTGDYVAAGVGLQRKGVNGFATGNIAIDPAQIPAGAEIVAAYLYWQTISSSGAPDASALRGAKFKGNDISQIAVLLDQAGTAPCWSEGGATGESRGSRATWSYRADVLRFFPRVRPSAAQPSGAGPGHGQPPGHAARHGQEQPSALHPRCRAGRRLPGDRLRPGDGVPGSPPATPGHRPLRRGQHPGPPHLAAPAAARGLLRGIACLAWRTDDAHGRRRPVQQERARADPRAPPPRADDRLVAINPFNGNSGFDVATFPNLPLEPGAMKATVTIDPGKKGCFDCLSLGAAVLSVVVQDRDGDGLLDVWESRSEWASKPSRLASVYPSWPLADPTGAPLPDLGGMGASPDVQDVFVQVDYLTGSDGHSHLPAKSALQSVATALHNAGPRPSLVKAGACLSTAAPGECPIHVHFDVGSNDQPPASFDPAQRAARRRPGPPTAPSFPPRCRRAETRSPRRRARRAASPPRARAAPSPGSQGWWAGRAGSGPTVMRWWIAPTAPSPAAQGSRAASRGCRGRGRTSSTTRCSPTRSGTARSATRRCRGATRASPTRAAETSWSPSACGTSRPERPSSRAPPCCTSSGTTSGCGTAASCPRARSSRTARPTTRA